MDYALAPQRKTKAKLISVISIEFMMILLMTLVTTGSLGIIMYGASDEVEGFQQQIQSAGSNFIRQLLLFPLYFYALFYLARRWMTALPIMSGCWPLTIITLLTIVSTIWSIDPEGTLRRSFILVGGTALGFYLAHRYSPPQLLALLGYGMLFTCVLTLLAVVVNPADAIHHDKHYPSVRGFFSHKNAMGNTMVISTMIGYMLYIQNETRKLGKVLIALSIFLTAISLSRSAWIGLALFFAVAMLTTFLRRSRVTAWVAIFFTTLIGGILYASIDTDALFSTFATSLGKDATLSGRAEIWDMVIQIVTRERPILGFGYDAFWTSVRGASSYAWGLFEDFVPGHAHNGWLQAYTHLGLVGVILLNLALIAGVKRNYTIMMRSKNAQYSFAFMFLLVYIFMNFTETLFLARDHFQWILFIYVYARTLRFDPELDRERMSRFFSPEGQLDSFGTSQTKK